MNSSDSLKAKLRIPTYGSKYELILLRTHVKILHVMIGFGLALILGGFGGSLRSQESPSESFTIAVLPDTQTYAMRRPDLFRKQTSWIVQNVKKENIVFVTQVGDIVENGDREREWQIANECLSMLDGIVPWGVALGNHDIDKKKSPEAGATFFLKYFNPERFKKHKWFGGHSPNGWSMYQRFEAGGGKFIFLHLEYDVPNGAIEWANQILKQFPDHHAILSTHIYLYDVTKKRDHRPNVPTPGRNSGEDIWQKFVSKNDQIFLVLCGHWYHAGGEWHQISVNEKGHQVLEVLANYQGKETTPAAKMRLMQFIPSQKKILVRTFCAGTGEFENDADSQFELPLAYKDREKNK